MAKKLIIYCVIAVCTFFICSCDGEQFTLSYSPAPSLAAQTPAVTRAPSAAPAQTVSPSPAVSPSPTARSGAYICNKNSKKFHLPDCANLPKEENRIYEDDRDKIIQDGYSPCGNCKP